MIVWSLYFVLALIFSAICYLTNWIVVLFCDKAGELSGLLHLWQTWDNSCDCSDSVEVAPKIFKYDWAKHYEEFKGTTEYLKSVNRDRWFVKCIDDNFTFKEKIQRYFCRMLWLMRNNSYGFCFYLLGRNVTPWLEIVSESEHTQFIREKNGIAWKYKNTAPIFTLFGWTLCWNNLLGWKIDDSAEVDTRAMVAIRVAFSFKQEV